MPMETGKPQIAQNAPVFAAADGQGIWNIEIGDSDFRTYVLLCQAAWQEQPQAEAPFTERNFAELARLHPARQRPTAETVRGRIYRLTKAGLIRRERSGRTAWRTYPLVDGLSMPKTQPNARKQGAQLAAREPVTSQLAARKLATSSYPSDLTARQARAQDRQLAASNLGTNGSVEILTARQEHTQGEPLAASTLATNTSAQVVTARPEHTQDEHLAASSLATSTCPQDMTARQEHTQDEPLAPSRATPPAFRSLALLHRNGTNPRKIVRRSVEMPEAPDAEAPKQKAIVYSLSEIAHILPANLRPAQIDGSVGARQEHTQGEQPAASEPEEDDVSARPEHTQEQQLATSSLTTSSSEQAVTARQTRAQEQIEPTNAVGARQEHSQDEPLAISTSAQVVTARCEHTQDGRATSNPAVSDSNQAVTARRARAQNEPLAPGVSPSRTRTRERASVLSGSDLPSSKTTPKPGGSSEPDSTGDTNARAKGPRPPVLERVQVPEGFEELAVQLANLRPQGMNYEGIAECMKNPELTCVWTEHALSTKEVIRNVPAYIRAGVRSGKPPVTDAEKEALQAERRTNPAALAATDYGWDDPALKDWDVSEIFRKPGPSKGKDKYGWGDPDETPPDPYGGPYVH